MKVALSGFIKATTQAKIFENLDSNAGSVFHIPPILPLISMFTQLITELQMTL